MSIVDEINKVRTPNTNQTVINSIKKRFSPRVFSPKPISQSDLKIILEAARHAPSGRNHQPWFYYIVRAETTAHKKLFSCIPERNFWAKTAPVVIIACFNPTEPNDGENRWATYDLGASVMSLVLQATELGYSCRQIGSFEWDKTKKEFSIPDPLQPFVLIAIGKMGTEEDYKKADQEIVQKDLAPNPKRNKIYQEL